MLKLHLERTQYIPKKNQPKWQLPRHILVKLLVFKEKKRSLAPGFKTLENKLDYLNRLWQWHFMPLENGMILNMWARSFTYRKINFKEKGPKRTNIQELWNTVSASPSGGTDRKTNVRQ